MKTSLGKYLLSVIAVVMAVVVVDKSMGFMMDYLWRSVPVTQDMGKGQFARNEVKTDLVVVGSSRAAHHYDVNMLSDSLGLSAYNVGLDGCFYLDNCCVMHALMERYSPKIIILEIAADAMYEEATNNLEGLYHYYWNDPYVKDIVDKEEGWQTGVKLMSSLYRHNANSFKTIGYGIKGLRAGKGEDPLHGYVPIKYREKRKELELKESSVDETGLTVSQRKVDLLHGLLATAKEKNIDVYVITSPSFHSPNTRNNKSTSAIEATCRSCGAYYWDYSSEPLFLENPRWFNDGAHLNEVGAREFSRLVAARIQKTCK